MYRKDFNNPLSLLLINFKIILFADFGPKPGSFEKSLISSSIAGILLSIYLGKLKSNGKDKIEFQELKRFFF